MISVLMYLLFVVVEKTASHRYKMTGGFWCQLASFNGFAFCDD
jgi:hypothetical protein